MKRSLVLAVPALALVGLTACGSNPPEQTAYEVELKVSGPAGESGTVQKSTSDSKDQAPEPVGVPHREKWAPMGGPAKFVVTPDSPASALTCEVLVEGKERVTERGQPGEPVTCELTIDGPA
ncbi:MAG: hypothetical protein IJH84_16035 [Saccharopolyspora sp.]|uniref:hypothetical protein n=1 Tax=Saccharopolyspora TaxID=1835 RepID=UPI00190BF9FB|nr:MULTISPECIES: hypothetical protein [unclassified Saccharopolyspora]MBK0869960.1 hypothetical protein [Saccharopolyspora sp. HNM0986]MBQ6642523.1 hypothetical protein [Saccharopolyspora sp.]